MKLDIKSNIRNYEVFFEKDYEFLNGLINIKNSIFIIDKNVYELYEDKFKNIQNK